MVQYGPRASETEGEKPCRLRTQALSQPSGTLLFRVEKPVGGSSPGIGQGGKGVRSKGAQE